MTDDTPSLDAVRASEHRYRRLFESAKDGILILDWASGRIADVNPFLINLLGYTHEEYLGKELSEIGPFRNIEATRSAFQGLKESGYVRYEDLPLETKDGRQIAVEFVSNVYTVDGQKVIQCNIRDITARKRTEESLRQSEKRFRRLVETANEGILTVDSKGTITFANPKMAAMVGATVEEALGRSIEEFLFDKEQIPLWRAKLASRRAVEHEAYEWRLRRRDGGVTWVHISAAALPDADGPGVGALAMVSDITESKRLTDAVRRSQELLEAVVDEMPAVIFAKDLEGRYLVVNRAWESLTGESREAAIGTATHDLLSKDVADSFREGDEHALSDADGAPVEREQILTIGGELRTFLTTRAPLRGPGGRIEGVVGVSVDLTERKRAEADRLRLSEAVEQAAEAIIVTNPDGTIVYVNPAFEHLSGYSRSEAIGQTPRILKSGSQDEAFYRDLWSSLTRGEGWKGRLVNRRKDGTLYEAEATISPVRSGSGDLVNYVAVQRDLTAERRLEEQLLQSQKMEAIGRLAAGVAHDFNNLLGIITGYGEIVLKRLPVADPLRLKVEQIVKAADRAAGLTRQLLAFSRQQVLQPRILDLNVVVAEMDRMLRRVIGEDVELATLLEPQLGSVKADPGQLEQVIMNLAVNARDAMPDGGRLTIETRNADLDTTYAATHPPTTPGPYVMLAISDTGSGMDSNVQAHVFEPFFTTKAPGKGTGLGLSTVYGIVKQSGGYVWVYSEAGVGTTFKIYLPRVDEAALPVPAEPLAPLVRGSETVLLVEDEAGLRDLLCEVLEANGYATLVSSEGAEALRMADTHTGPIHLLVTDVIMPGMTGRAAADAIQRARPGIKVLYISGYTDEAILRHGVLGAGVAFLSKPFTSEGLLRKVRELLDAP